MDNLGYIVAAYGLILLTLAWYEFRLLRKIGQVQRQVKALKAPKEQHNS